MKNLVDSKIGENVKAKNGLMMTIIAYRNNHDIDIRFEDGIIIKNKAYGDFLKGRIGHPYKKTPLPTKRDKRIGEKKINREGILMEIIAYKDCGNVDIKFETGEIVTNKKYHQFKIGQIMRPRKSRIGEERIATCGMKMKIVNYRSCSDLDVQFEDGTIIKNVAYKEFDRGSIRNPNFINPRLGEESVSTEGQKMKIIEYNGCTDVTVEFEDGTILRKKRYLDFKNGKIKNPNLIINKNINLEKIANNGLKMKIIAYRTWNDIDIEFEDGFVVKSVSKSHFDTCGVRHPKFKEKTILKSEDYFGYTVKFAFNQNDKKYYYAINNTTGFEILATLQELYKGSIKND